MVWTDAEVGEQQLLAAWVLASAVRFSCHKNGINVFERLRIVGFQDPALLADVVFVEDSETATCYLSGPFRTQAWNELSIECGGDRCLPLDKLPEDMDRQSVLERMGWIFRRIRSSEFFRNPPRTMKPVIEKLQMLEIPPVSNSADANPEGLHAAGGLPSRSAVGQSIW